MFKITKLNKAVKVKLANISLRAAAKDSGISHSTLSRISNGSIPDLGTYHKLCIWLNVSQDYFLWKPETNEIHTDCRTDDGITVSLIDAIITQCRVLKNRNLDSIEVKEAIQDLKNDEDLQFILNQ